MKARTWRWQFLRDWLIKVDAMTRKCQKRPISSKNLPFKPFWFREYFYKWHTLICATSLRHKVENYSKSLVYTLSCAILFFKQFWGENSNIQKIRMLSLVWKFKTIFAFWWCSNTVMPDRRALFRALDFLTIFIHLLMSLSAAKS